MSGIEVFRGGRSKFYGNIGGEITEWDISTSEPIVGLYGYESSRGIEALSIITLDLECQQNPEEQDDDTATGTTTSTT